MVAYLTANQTEPPMPATQIINDDLDADYWLTNIHRKAEVHLSPSEQRGRWLSIEEANNETQMHLVEAKPCPYAEVFCVGSLTTAGLAIILAGIVLVHVVLLPDATVSPMSIASLICGASSGLMAWAGLRGRS